MNKIDIIGVWVTLASALIMVGFYMNALVGFIVTLILLLILSD